MRSYIYKKFTDTPDFFIFIFFLFLTIFVRFAFWFRAVIDWDESTFILMGQSLLDGELLYRDLWDLKPPLIFVSFALFIKLFGKSVIAVRVGGAVCVLLSAVLTYYIGRKAFGRFSAALAGATFILVASLLHRGQATLTEHIALVPLLGGVLILLSRSFSLRLMLALGALISAAALVRLNLAYVAVLVGGIVVFHPSHEYIPARIMAGAAYAAGGLGVVALTALPYVISGEGDLWWMSLVVAPLAYAGAQPPLDAFLKLVGGYFQRGDAAFWFGSLFFTLSLGSMGWAISRLTVKGSENKREIAIVVIVTMGIGMTLVKGGAYWHYLLQIAPFLSLFAAAGLERSLCSRFFAPTALIFLVVVALALRPTYWEYRVLAARAAAGEALTHGTAYEIADYVASLRLADYTMFLMSDHVVYWLLDKPLPTRMAHPSNLFKPYLLRLVRGPDATPITETAAIFDRAPTIVVKRIDEWYLRDFPVERQYIEKRLENYDLVRVIGTRQIYRIRDAAPKGSSKAKP